MRSVALDAFLEARAMLRTVAGAIHREHVEAFVEDQPVHPERRLLAVDDLDRSPEGKWGYVRSANFNCDKGFPPSEVCRFN